VSLDRGDCARLILVGRRGPSPRRRPVLYDRRVFRIRGRFSVLAFVERPAIGIAKTISRSIRERRLAQLEEPARLRHNARISELTSLRRGGTAAASGKRAKKPQIRCVGARLLSVDKLV
jgi:hypothetical protein